MSMKRVLCLYRVSTKGQVDKITDDIPMQRRECLDFIAKQEDWDALSTLESYFCERKER